MLSLSELLNLSVEKEASDIFIIAGQPLSCKINREIVKLDDLKIMPDMSHKLVEDCYQMAGRPMEHLLQTGDDDFSMSVNGLARMRVSAYRQRGSLAAVIRIISFGIPSYQEVGISESIMELSETQKGLILVTGAAGSGKSTTLACLIDRINKTRSGHIITLEDPIEFLYRNDKSIVSQREVAIDTGDYLTALRACLRQAPDVILLGEMRDFETIKTAMTAAETGHLVLSTLHTTGAVNTIDRIIDIFPPSQQHQIRIQLSMVLRSVISQQLVPTVDNRVAPAFEIMHVNNAIKNMIREQKSHQIDLTIGVSQSEGMVTMDASLIELYKAGKISRDTALRSSIAPDVLAKKI